MAKVSEIAQQLRGVTYTKEEAVSSPTPGHIALLRAGNITDSGLRFDDLLFVPEYRVSAKQRLRPNDVLIAASSGSLEVVGKAGQVLEPTAATFGAFCKVLRPSRDVDARYFAHFFSTPSYRRRISALAAGANINNLRSEHLNDLAIPLPSPAEQRRIADILDRADALRAKRRESLALLDDLTQSIFLDMFGDPAASGGWPEVYLGDIVRAIGSGRSPNCESRPASADEWGVLKLGAVTYGVFDASENKAYLGDARVMSDNEVHRNDLLMTRKNTHELVGAVTLVGEVRPRLLLPDLVFRLEVDEKRVLKTYLQALLMNPRKRPQVRDLASGSAASMPNISKARLRQLPVAVPPLSLQRHFQHRVTAAGSCRRPMATTRDAVDELFVSLQQRAFAGEL